MIRGLETKSYEERSKELGKVSFGKRALKRELMIAPFKYLKGYLSREGQQDLFFTIPKCRTQNNGFKVQEANFQLNVQNNMTIKPIT